MPVIRGVVEGVYENDVTTKYGQKKATNFKVDGQYYSGGFKSYSILKGAEVEITYQTNAKGYNDIKKIEMVSEGGGLEAAVAPKSKSIGRTFPIDPLAPERAINRQNALTAAVNYVTTIYSVVTEAEVPTEEDVIDIARKFEAYTTGDLDREEAIRRIENGE